MTEFVTERYHQMIQLVMREDHGIANLLDLHDQIIDQDNGYWVKSRLGVRGDSRRPTRNPLFPDAPRALRKADFGLRQRACGKAAEEVQVCRAAPDLRSQAPA